MSWEGVLIGRLGVRFSWEAWGVMEDRGELGAGVPGMHFVTSITGVEPPRSAGTLQQPG